MENSQAERGSRGPVIHSFPTVLECGGGEETGVDCTLKCGNIVALRLSELTDTWVTFLDKWEEREHSTPVVQLLIDWADGGQAQQWCGKRRH